MHLQLVSTFRLNKHSFETFQRLHLQIYKHSNAFCYEIKKYTSCAIHMHSGKSYNPVSCERAQVTPLIWVAPTPSLWFWLEPPLILRFDVLTEMYKKEEKKN